MRTVIVKAFATREGNWWVAEVDGIGTTQGRSMREASRMCQDLAELAAIHVQGDDTIRIEVELDFGLDEALVLRTEKVKAATEAAAAAQLAAAKDMRAVVADLIDDGISKTDIAFIFDVSPQRISQLMKKGK